MTRYTETRPKHETTRPRNLIRDYENARTNLGDQTVGSSVMLLFKSSTFGSWPLFSGSTGSSHACFRKINILYSPQLQTQYILM